MDFTTFAEQPSYRDFRDAFSQRKLPLVIVCGAGASSSAGLPTWKGLRATIEHEARLKINNMNQIGSRIYDAKYRTACETSDYWVSFELFREILGLQTFRNTVAAALTPREDSVAPKEYDQLLRLKPRGAVTLNLDKYLAESFARANPGLPVNTIYGTELAQKWETVAFGNQYLIHLHGELNNPHSWILTQSDLSKLLETEGHRQFLFKLYSESLVLFVGMSVDDMALSRRMLTFRKHNFIPPALYWLTTRRDTDTLAWADENSIAQILYRAQTADEHFLHLQTIVNDLVQFVPKDVDKPEIILNSPKFSTSEKMEDPDTLAQREPEHIRKVISDALHRRLENAPIEKHYEIFDDFSEQYDFAISRAFYRADKEKFRRWFNYELNFPSLGKGNFGEVYRANKPKQADQGVGVKVLNQNILRDRNMLLGFRRGVRSMIILTESEIDGTAKLIESFELPPTIVMEYINGVTLQEAVLTSPKLSWYSRLALICRTAQIVFSGHSLPQTIMHRDLKPSNIMIRDFEYDEIIDPDVVVLDFDMSWHKGADDEKDVVFESRDDFGYLAPEQTSQVKGVSARSTRVDSYGLGMTAYFVFGGNHPRPNEGLSENWPDTAVRAAKSGYNGKWKSAPYRLARIICDCTQIDQSKRLDFSDALRDFTAVRDAVSNPAELKHPELWAEEILASLPSAANYKWDRNRNMGVITLDRGIKISAWPSPNQQAVEFAMEFANQGGQQYTKLTQRIERLQVEVPRLLSEIGCVVGENNKGLYELRIFASISVLHILENTDAVKVKFAEAYRAFEKLGGVW